MKPCPPSSNAITSDAVPTHAGQNKRSRNSSPLAFRHGSTGATAIKNNSAITTGDVMRLKYGEPDRHATRC